MGPVPDHQTVPPRILLQARARVELLEMGGS